MDAPLYFKTIEETSPLALIEYSTGRIFRTTRTLGLGDCASDGILRFDAAARIAQDIASEDLADSGVADEGVWVVRRTHIRFKGAPKYQDRISVSTFCAGVGRAWAQRRTRLESPNGAVEVSSLWVQTDPISRSPKSLSSHFHQIFGPSARGRSTGARLEITEGQEYETFAWPPRVTDIDVLGHLNNAAYFEALEQIAYRNHCVRADSAIVFAVAEYREGVNSGEDIELRISNQSSDGFQLDFFSSGKNQCSIIWGKDGDPTL